MLELQQYTRLIESLCSLIKIFSIKKIFYIELYKDPPWMTEKLKEKIKCKNKVFKEYFKKW